MELQNKFLERRCDILKQDIENTRKCLYTWAILLKRSINEIHEHLGQSSYDQENQIADLIINNFIGNTNTTLENNLIEQGSTYVDKLIEDARNEDLIESKPARPDNIESNDQLNNSMEDMANDLLEQNIKENEELMSHMQERRELMKKQMEDPKKSDINFTLDVVEKKPPSAKERKMMKLADKLNGKDVPEEKKQKNLPTEEDIRRAEEREKKKMEEGIFAGNPLSPDTMARKAPVITPLINLTKRQRNDMIRNKFEKAKDKIFIMLANKHKVNKLHFEDIFNNKEVDNPRISKDKLEEMVFKETDKLIEIWKKNYRVRG
jgi:hypothetical protein